MPDDHTRKEKHARFQGRGRVLDEGRNIIYLTCMVVIVMVAGAFVGAKAVW